MEAVVYLVEDIQLGGKLRVVKRYKEHAPIDFMRERDVLVTLNHPFVPSIVDYIVPSEAAPAGCLVTDYVAGETIQERFESSGRRVNELTVLEWSMQLCDILTYLHTLTPHPVIYRDLKPGNLLLDAAGRVHLIDFGSARRYKPDGLLDTVQLGTTGFAAPEQFEQEQSDVRTDLYGLGALMHVLLNKGKLHYFAQTAVKARAGGMTRDTARILNRLLAYDRSHRFQSAAETKQALEAAARRALTPWQRLRRQLQGKG